ncbi:MAG: hypothetical protein OHK0022_51860 [Roseiflexaceae bacterium]
MNDSAVLFQIIGFGVFLWLGSYLLVRARRLSPLIVVSVVGLLSQAAFFAAGALTDSTTDQGLLALLERASWWSTVVPLATWFHFSRLIARSGREHVPRLHELPLWLVYVAAGLISLLGGLTDLFVVVEGGRTRPGVAYPVYILYLVLAVGGALINFVRSLRRAAVHPQQSRGLLPQLWLLVCGSLGFLAGALWLAASYSWNLRLPEVPGYLCVLVGLGALGYGVAHFGLMLEGQRIERDFLYTITSIALLNLLYLGLLVPAGASAVPALLLLVALVTLTHTAYDKGRSLLDRLFFTQDEQDARAAARDYATSLGTDPVVPPELPEEQLPMPAAEVLAAIATPPAAPAEPLHPPEPTATPAAPAPDPAARRTLPGQRAPGDLRHQEPAPAGPERAADAGAGRAAGGTSRPRGQPPEPNRRAARAADRLYRGPAPDRQRPARGHQRCLALLQCAVLPVCARRVAQSRPGRGAPHVRRAPPPRPRHPRAAGAGAGLAGRHRRGHLLQMAAPRLRHDRRYSVGGRGSSDEGLGVGG